MSKQARKARWHVEHKQNKSKTKFYQKQLSKWIIFWKTDFVRKTQNDQ